MLDFIGIGAQKAGTSWLYTMLKMHPDINFPAGKEVHFWDQYYSHGIEWYVDLFRSSAQRGIAGEITPAYAILPPERIKEMSDYFPELKILFSIRNPIDRAWSQALMHLNRTARSVDIDTIEDEWFFQFFSSAGSVQRGDYETCLCPWFHFYDPSHFLIFRFKEICQSPRDLLMKCCIHVGVDPDFYSEVDESIMHQKIFQSENYPLRPSLRNFLKELYKAKIKKLQNLLAVDLSDWLEEKVSV